MKKKSRHPNFDQTLEILHARGFEVAPYASVPGGTLVSKDSVGAVLVAHPDGAALAVTPGALIRGEVARLLDRGYQKFIKTSQYELPATAKLLRAIHQVSEELKQLIGVADLYNEALGTTSDLYVYDRLKGRETAQPAPARPWELIQLGNCGSPIETPAGWLVFTHGVGPMREYAIGAILLDLDEPERLISALPEPLLAADESERDGYVPNVVYSCGSLLHGGTVVLPYGCSDSSVRIATVDLAQLLAKLTG